MKRILFVIILIPSLLFGIVKNEGANLILTSGVKLIFYGDFQNNGSVQNNGEININGDFVNNGSFVSNDNSIVKYVGENQIVSGEVYEKLIISGSGIKTLNGNSQIKDTLQIISSKLDLNGNNIVFQPDAILQETEGHTIIGNGEISITLNLDNPNNENIAGFGFGISSQENLGETQIIRGQTPFSIYNKEGIKRYFKILPSNNQNLNATIYFNYDETELNNNDEEYLNIFESQDNGQNWQFDGGTTYPQQNKVVLNQVDSLATLSCATLLYSDFTATPTTGYLPLDVHFSDISYSHNGITSWKWDFNNDGIIDSYEQNPTYTYTYPGNYTVSLTITDSILSDKETKYNLIEVNQIQHPVIVINPDSIQFGNVCINETATLPITVHNYGAQTLEISNILTSTDRFSVTLPSQKTDIGDLQEMTINSKKSILKKKNPHNRDISFTIQPLDSQVVYVHFSSLELTHIEGTLYFLTNDPQNSMLSYAVSGTGYQLIADFTVNTTSGDIPLEVNFTNNSVGDILNYLWDFGDGNTSNTENPTHIYNNEGVYTVSLTIADRYHQKTKVVDSLITAIAHPILYSPDSLGIDFGTIYLTNSSGDSLIVIQNIGTKAFQINSLTLQNGIDAFHYSYSNLNELIRPNESDTIYVNFAPTTTGTFFDRLIISNTSENLSSFTLELRGICEIVPPMAPQNVSININNYNTTLSWEPVNKNIYGYPIIPDGYLVYSNEIPSQSTNDYTFLAFVQNDTTYTHLNSARFSKKMFYKIVAIIGLTREQIDFLNGLNFAKRQIKVFELNKNLKKIKKKKN